MKILNLISIFLLLSISAFAAIVDDNEIFSYVARGDADTLRGWVISGGRLDVQDAKGNTALILAAEDGHVEMVTTLLNNGADINLTNNFGYTALWTAVSGKHPLIISALVSAGADSSIKNIYGTSVDDYIKALGFKDPFSYAMSLPPSQFKTGPNSARHIPLWEKKADSLLAQNLFTDAEAVLKAVADNGDKYARYRLGKLYLDSGYMDLAVIYLTSAADMDVLPAQIALSRYYFDTAERHPVYTALGFKYQRMAADSSYPPAVLETGKCYMYGIGTPVDHQAAYRYFRLASRLGLIDAYYFMGAQHYYGMGMQADRARGMEEIISAASAGSLEAQAQLKRFKTEDIFEALINLQSKPDISSYLLAHNASFLMSEGNCDIYNIADAVHPDYGVYKLSLCSGAEGSPIQLIFNVYKDMLPVYKEFLINYQMKRSNVIYIVDGAL